MQRTNTYPYNAVAFPVADQQASYRAVDSIANQVAKDLHMDVGTPKNLKGLSDQDGERPCSMRMRRALERNG